MLPWRYRNLYPFPTFTGIWHEPLGKILSPTLQELLREKRWTDLKDYLSTLDPSDVADILLETPDRDDAAIFRLASARPAGRVFFLSAA